MSSARAAMPRTDAGRRRCAIYTRKSSEEGLEQEFNSLAAQREACEAYIRSQQHEGWVLTRTRYDDGGFSGGNLERPALQRLLADIHTAASTSSSSTRSTGSPDRSPILPGSSKSSTPRLCRSSR